MTPTRKMMMCDLAWYWWVAMALYGIGILAAGALALGMLALGGICGGRPSLKDLALTLLSALFWPIAAVVWWLCFRREDDW